MRRAFNDNAAARAALPGAEKIHFTAARGIDGDVFRSNRGLGSPFNSHCSGRIIRFNTISRRGNRGFTAIKREKNAAVNGRVVCASLGLKTDSFGIYGQIAADRTVDIVIKGRLKRVGSGCNRHIA